MTIGRAVVTNAWEQIATGAVTITVDKQGDGTLRLNETATDVDALNSSPLPGEQFIQNEAKATFARSDGNGWELRLDGAL